MQTREACLLRSPAPSTPFLAYPLGHRGQVSRCPGDDAALGAGRVGCAISDHGRAGRRRSLCSVSGMEGVC